MTARPTRRQWLVLATMREGAVKRMPSLSSGVRGAQRSNTRTNRSVQARGWVLYDEAQGYVLTAAGQTALAVGDRRYQKAEREYARRPL